MSPLRQLATRNYEDKKPEWCRIFWYNAANSSCQIITTLFTPADEERAIGSSGKRNKWEKMWCRKVERNENRARRTGINNKKKKEIKRGKVWMEGRWRDMRKGMDERNGRGKGCIGGAEQIWKERKNEEFHNRPAFQTCCEGCIGTAVLIQQTSIDKYCSNQASESKFTLVLI